MWHGRGGVPFLSYEKGFGGEKIQRSTRTLSGATRLHEAGILRYRGCIHLTATSSDRFNTFFSLKIALLQGRIPLLVVDALPPFFLHRYALKAPLLRSTAQR